MLFIVEKLIILYTIKWCVIDGLKFQILCYSLNIMRVIYSWKIARKMHNLKMTWVLITLQIACICEGKKVYLSLNFYWKAKTLIIKSTDNFNAQIFLRRRPVGLKCSKVSQRITWRTHFLHGIVRWRFFNKQESLI